MEPGSASQSSESIKSSESIEIRKPTTNVFEDIRLGLGSTKFSNFKIWKSFESDNDSASGSLDLSFDAQSDSDNENDTIVISDNSDNDNEIKEVEGNSSYVERILESLSAPNSPEDFNFSNATPSSQVQYFVQKRVDFRKFSISKVFLG